MILAKGRGYFPSSPGAISAFTRAHMICRSLFLFAIFAVAAVLPAGAEDFQGADHPLEYDEAPVKYSTTEPADPVAGLAKRDCGG